MRFGSSMSGLHLKDARTVTVSSSNLRWDDLYTVPLYSISIGDLRVDYDYSKFQMNPGKVFFDTGSTYTYFSEELFSSWKKNFDRFCKRSEANCLGRSHYENCYEVQKSDFDFEKSALSFPKVTFSFGEEKDFVWHPEDYLTEIEGAVCVGVKPMKDVIFGANFMRNYDIAFDLGTQRISFTRSNCTGTERNYVEEEKKRSLYETISFAGKMMTVLAIYGLVVGF